jgi:hypothetical protein
MSTMAIGRSGQHEAHEAKNEASNDGCQKRDGTHLSRNGEAGDQGVALVPDQALPVAHAYARILRRQRSLKARTPVANIRMIRKYVSAAPV